MMRDDERPAVTAHEEFVQHRDVFDGLSLQERFVKIHQMNLWGAETSVSGLGSEEDATKRLREELPKLLDQLQIKTLLDAPCGDASWINQIEWDVEYIGADIVPEIVQSLQHAKEQKRICGEYLLADLTCDDLPKADAVLCRDCLVHFSFEMIQKAVHNIKRSRAKYLITTTFPQWNVNRDIENGDWRALNFEHFPFDWGNPVAVINEGCAESDGGYSDKSLGVWELVTL